VLRLDGDKEALRRRFFGGAGFGQGIVEIECARGVLRCADVEQAREVRKMVGLPPVAIPVRKLESGRSGQPVG